MNRSISIPEWHQMAMMGSAPLVRIQLNGFCIYPLIRWRRDYVTIVPLKECPVIGDIVLLCVPDAARYVVHRVWEIKDGKILTWGDNCEKPDGWLPAEAIWGKVLLIERGKRKIQPDPIKGMRWAKFWHQAGKIYRLFQRYKAGIVHRICKKKA